MSDETNEDYFKNCTHATSQPSEPVTLEALEKTMQSLLDVQETPQEQFYRRLLPLHSFAYDGSPRFVILPNLLACLGISVEALDGIPVAAPKKELRLWKDEEQDDG